MARQEIIEVIHGAVMWLVADTQSMGGCKGRAYLMFSLDSKDRSQRRKLKFGVSWHYHHQECRHWNWEEIVNVGTN